jgi:mRNA-degrading endonuclease toxin of MazEF toxin-antitoxin module
MKRGEIWLVGLDPAQGHEQKGRRPVLIVSPEAFNRVTKVPVVLPITSGGSFARTAGFAVSLSGAGTTTQGIVRWGDQQ